ncbi:hypothetical protein CRG98_041459 [Punica granatum]|uniref:Uncharacterized protein n=1 Tax=Punica granatum TaxID=22663 RepID=A0A2I0I438_PUNGR|nr:hypothetical protein CRG98_041459 [Punica granatum]
MSRASWAAGRWLDWAERAVGPDWPKWATGLLEWATGPLESALGRIRPLLGRLDCYWAGLGCWSTSYRLGVTDPGGRGLPGGGSRRLRDGFGLN